MKYFAPVTDYIPKSTFVIREFYPVDQWNDTEDESGWSITGAGDKVYIFFHVKPSIYIINSINIVFNGLVNGNNMKFNVRMLNGTDGEGYDNHDVLAANQNITSIVADELLFFDITSLFTLLGAGDSAECQITYSATATATNLYVRGLVIDYSLV